MLPLFFIQNISTTAIHICLNEDTSKHIAQVLRMQVGEQLQLTNGEGELLTVAITDNNKKATQVTIINKESIAKPTKKVTIGISPIKNAARLEWFLEKATEIGVTTILPILCERTEKQYFKEDRIKNILISAMLQSRQVWLPNLVSATKFVDAIHNSNNLVKLIAHCISDNDKCNINTIKNVTDAIMLIGPEGDFTNKEIELALQNNFVPVSLGNTRLRTETAGIVAATLLIHQ